MQEAGFRDTSTTDNRSSAEVLDAGQALIADRRRQIAALSARASRCSALTVEIEQKCPAFSEAQQ
jgi:hypothetical protein